MGVILKSRAGIACAALLIACSTPAAASVTISFTGGNSPVNGNPGNILTFSNGTISVQASAFDLNNNAIQRAFLGSYSAGLGVTNPNENGSSNSHTIDNQGQYDFVILVFNQAVNIQSAVLTPFSIAGQTPDNDATVSFASLAGAYTSPVPTPLVLNNSNAIWQALTANAWSINGSSGASVFNSAGNFGNVWLIGAAAPNPDRTYDGFKLSSIVVNTRTAVPEPSTWAMMLLGFAGVGLATRRARRSVLKPPTATAG